MSIDELLTALVALFFPFAAHMGAVGSDQWRPRAEGLLRSKLGKLIVRRMNTVLFLNGILIAAAYASWRLLQDPYFLVPLIAALPTVAAQFALAAESGRQSSR